jgi:TRAP-type mannitol/chloroaromatic compound transport system permease large subunit
MLANVLDILMFVTVCGFLLAGFPVAFTLAGTALLFALLGLGAGIFDMSFFGALPSRIYGNAMTNEVLIAVPLFVFMGVMLERSKVAEELLETMGKLFGRLRGGLGYSVAAVGALMAASTGIVGATVVTMGLLSLPTMLRRGYDPKLACGSICASGTLGQIIPPSIILVLLGDQISIAYVDAQRAIGNWSPEPVSVGDLFAGALLPGLMLVGLYIGYQALVAWLRPESSPAMPREESETGRALVVKVLHALVPPIVLMVAVLGSILGGVATPTEAASVGAVGATLLAGLRLGEMGETPPPTGFARRLDDGTRRPITFAGAALVILIVLQAAMDRRLKRGVIAMGDWLGIAVAGVACLLLVHGLIVALLRVHRGAVLTAVTRSTLQITTMVFVILIGAAVFSLVFRGLGGDELVHAALSDLPGGDAGAILVVMVVMFVLGFFLDFIEITFVVVPLVAPVLLQSDISPVWLGVMMAINLQTSFLTPPFGFALFYLRGVAPASVPTTAIYRGAIPFVIIQLNALGLLALVPGLATWLPGLVFG